MTAGKTEGRERDARAKRLADALRANLRRRKLQARGRAGAQDEKPEPKQTGAAAKESGH